MDLLFGRPKYQRLIDEEKVSCPLRAKDVDLERCASCPWLQRVDRATGTLTCQPVLDQFVPFVS